jgi:muramoyltetrapeptide carboxypeptidase
MFASDFACETPSEFTQNQFWQCLQGPQHTVHVSQTNNPLLEAEGRLWGGNLSMLNHLLATPYWPQIDNGILFVEDVGEHPYRIERMLLQLHHAGVLERQQALILGDFSDYRLSPYDNGYDFDTMLGFLRHRIPIPILTGLPFGHGKERASLALGSWAHLRSNHVGFELQMQGYRALGSQITPNRPK